MREAWQEIRHTIGIGPLAVVTAYAAAAFAAFGLGFHDVPKALESSLYSILMLFVWLLLIVHFTRPSQSLLPDGSALSVPITVKRPGRELSLLLIILSVDALLASWVWLGPSGLRWPSWAFALAALYGLSMAFLRLRGYGPEHVGLDLKGGWRLYLLVIVGQMLLAQLVTPALPAGVWRRDIVGGLIALTVVAGFAGLLASPVMGRWRIGLSGFAKDLGSLGPFLGLIAFVMVSQVVGSIIFVGDISIFTRPLFPLNGYFAQGPVPEEIFYRGLLQTRLQAAFLAIFPSSKAAGWAILLTGVIFAAMHIPSHLATGGDLTVELLDLTGGLANAFAAGYLYQRTKNLLPVIVIHSLSFL